MNKKPEANRHQLAWQPELRPAIPTVYGPLDYRIVRDQLIEIDRLLLCGIEADFVREVLSDLNTILSPNPARLILILFQNKTKAACFAA